MNRTRSPKLRLIVALLATMTLLAGRSLADGEEKMPSARFAAILGRLLTYDSNLKARAGNSIGIAVLYRRNHVESQSEANETARHVGALESTEMLELPVKTYKIAFDDEAGLEKAVASYGLDVFIVSGGMAEQMAIVKNVGTRRKIITIGKESAQARNGLSVAIFVADGKSKILVNLGASKKAGANFTPELLRLCEVIP
jgi:hypothetical protein